MFYVSLVQLLCFAAFKALEEALTNMDVPKRKWERIVRRAKEVLRGLHEDY